MKKEKFLFVFALILILASSFVYSITLTHAQGAPGINESPFASEILQGQQQFEQYTTAENKSAYLTQQWGDLLGRARYIGPVFKGINSFFSFLNPFFRIVLGYGYGLSWAFIFALSIWLIIFFFVKPILSQLLKNSLLGLIASIAVASLVGLSGVIKKTVDLLTTMINNAWIAWISLALAIILAFLFSMIGKKIKAKIEKMKKEAEEEKTTIAQQTIQAEGEAAKEQLESFG